jgi:hypothetical protein
MLSPTSCDLSTTWSEIKKLKLQCNTEPLLCFYVHSVVCSCLPLENLNTDVKASV